MDDREHPVSRRVRRLDDAIEWAAYREFALVHGEWHEEDDPTPA